MQLQRAPWWLLAFTIGLALVAAPSVRAQEGGPAGPLTNSLAEETLPPLAQLRNVAIRLPTAALLGAALAFRPRRRGTPPRSAPVVQTQIVLAIIGALVMIVVGSSVARAFGVVGVAGLIRYRAKIDDPKDASVMLGTLAIGLASGVGLYPIAAFGALFLMMVLWLIESLEPNPRKVLTLKITSKEIEPLRPRVEQVLRRHKLAYELRGESPEELTYEVKLPLDARTDALSRAIVALDEASAVEWEEKKTKDK
jgi:uncharacterized membrane protein YhiD involved in acid resistance